MGLRVRLKAGFDVWGFTARVRVILTALKKYGMIVADNGSELVHQRRPGPALERRSATRPRTGEGQRLRGGRLTGAAAGRVLRGAQVDGDGAPRARVEPAGIVLRSVRRAVDGHRRATATARRRRSLALTAAQTFSLAHRYRRAHHRYTVTVTVRDDRGLTAIAHVRVRVR